ncbi:hypothetical protein CRUP_004536 [Coryphaenoides rupestris]|nr:hypothetical protein CRUP_004536 [Coryphaenoides rupestris]
MSCSRSRRLHYTKVVPEEITPLVPAVAGEKVADDQTCYMLQTLLKFMVTQASSLEWKNKETQDTGFRFLFSLFKKYYLPHLFPSFTKLTNLYKPLLDLPHHRPKPLYVPVTRNNESTFCTRDQYLAPRVAFITWLVTFFLEKKYVSSAAAAAPGAKNGTEVLPKLIQTVTAGSSSQEKEKGRVGEEEVVVVEEEEEEEEEVEVEGGEPGWPLAAAAAGEPEKSHSQQQHACRAAGQRNSSLCSIGRSQRCVYDLVAAPSWLSTGDNAFLLPSCEASATRKVIKVYRKWILQEKPSFMTEPDKSSQEEEVDEVPQQPPNREIPSPYFPPVPEVQGHKRSSSWGRTYSFSSAISRGCLTEQQNLDIKAGVQSTLQVFLTNSSNVFLLEPCQDVAKLLDNQVEVCKGVLSIYRHMIMEHTMNTQTWEQMLQVLLRIYRGGDEEPQEDHRKDVFAESLAAILFRLWDELLAVLSSLTAWEELVAEWAGIMDSLTAVLARSVYGLDMADLPLDKLSVTPDSQKAAAAAAVARSFSLSWRNHGEHGGQEPAMRIRSATTSGAPGVEKARNNVRQKASGPAAADMKRGRGHRHLIPHLFFFSRSN